MTINPKWGMWISIAAAVISALLLCGTEFGILFGEGSKDKILAALVIVNAVINGVNAVLHAIPATTPPNATVASKFLLGPNPV